MARSAELNILTTCTGCGRCVSACPHNALTLEAEFPDGRGSKTALVDRERCTACGECVESCPHEALRLET